MHTFRPHKVRKVSLRLSLNLLWTTLHLPRTSRNRKYEIVLYTYKSKAWFNVLNLKDCLTENCFKFFLQTIIFLGVRFRKKRQINIFGRIKSFPPPPKKSYSDIQFFYQQNVCWYDWWTLPLQQTGLGHQHQWSDVWPSHKWIWRRQSRPDHRWMFFKLSMF